MFESAVIEELPVFMVCLWLFSAFAGLCSTLVPLLLGRYLLTKVIPDGLRVSDIYAYSLGAYIVGGMLFAALKGKAAAGYVKDKAATVDVRAWIARVTRFSTKLLKCIYVLVFAVCRTRVRGSCIPQALDPRTTG